MLIYWRTKVSCKILQKRDNGYVIVQYGENSITSCHVNELIYLN